jgi:putative addiction module antidote
MAIEVKVRKVGNSLGITLSKEALAALQVEEGSSLYLSAAPDGSHRISAHDPDFASRLAIAEDLSRRYRNALKELAK